MPVLSGDEVKAARFGLAKQLGGRLTQEQFGIGLGLAVSSAGRTVRAWESDGVDGPAALAITYLISGCLADQTVVPEYVLARSVAGKKVPLVLRLWWPRFIAVVQSTHGGRAPGPPRITVVRWLDDATAFQVPDATVAALLARAASAVAKHGQVTTRMAAKRGGQA